MAGAPVNGSLEIARKMAAGLPKVKCRFALDPIVARYDAAAEVAVVAAHSSTRQHFAADSLGTVEQRSNYVTLNRWLAVATNLHCHHSRLAGSVSKRGQRAVLPLFCPTRQIAFVKYEIRANLARLADGVPGRENAPALPMPRSPPVCC